MRRTHGLVYTLFAIATVASIMLLLSIQSDYKPEMHVAEKIRGSEMNYLEGGISSDLGRGTLISGKRAVLSLVNSEIVSGQYNSTANASIKDIMLTGRYNSTDAPLMANATLSDWAGAITSLSSGMGYNNSIKITDVRVSAKDAFGLNIISLSDILLSDSRLSMQISRTKNFSAYVGIDNSEDPFVAVESFGYAKQQIAKCSTVLGASGSSDWAWGTAYINLTETNFADVPDKAKKVLVVTTLSGKSNYGGFAAIVSENAADSPPAPYIVGVPGATTGVKKDSLVVKYGTALWLTNITSEPKNSCYFESPSGPSFLDRLEGTKTLSAKYAVAGVNTGIGSFIYVPALPPELQHGADTYAIDYQYFA